MGKVKKLKSPSEDASVPLGREKKATTSGERGGPGERGQSKSKRARERGVGKQPLL